MTAIKFGFEPLSRQSFLGRQIVSLREQSDQARVEAVNGRSADAARKLGGRTADLREAEKAVAEFDAYAEIIGLAEGRGQTIQAILQNALDSANDVLATAVPALSGEIGAGKITLSYAAEYALQTLVASLNTSYASRGLFTGDSGGVTSLVDYETIMAEAKALIDAELAGGGSGGTAWAEVKTDFLAAGGVFDTTLYVGGAGTAPPVQAAPGFEVDLSLRADDPTLRNVILNLAVIANAYNVDNAYDFETGDLLAGAAVDDLRTAGANISILQGRIGAAQERIEDAKARNEAARTTLSFTVNDLSGVDPYDASVRLTELEGQLDVAFNVTARLNNLSLANYIR